MRESGVEVPKVKTNKMADSTCKQRIVLDMSFDDLMSDKVITNELMTSILNIYVRHFLLLFILFFFKF